MVQLNKNYQNLQENYLFSKISKKVAEYQKMNPEKSIIKIGIGDVTLPIPTIITDAMKNAAEEMSHLETFRGYGPEQGYEFLREKIVEEDYKKRGINLEIDEIFISDGAKSDTANFQELFSENNIIAITDPVYPVYLDTNVMSGRTGKFTNGKYEKVVYMPVTKENNFEPELPKEKVDIIYLCFPNNPTGTVLNKQQLKKWVDYAIENESIILFDSAYEAFIEEENIPHSIYEIEDAKKVAVEFRSFSKTAGFTGIRCAYTVVPKEIKYELNKMWKRRQCTKFNGTSYIIQRGAEAVYSENGKSEIMKNIQYYKENAKIILEELKKVGILVYGGINSPYIWMKCPNNMKSWEFFDVLLKEANVVGTPGVGFGPSGEGYFRLSAFNTKENTEEAMKRIQKMFS